MKVLRLLHDTRGTSAVEFALTAPVYFLLMFGLIGGGMLVWTQIGLQHGAEEAARCASINTSLCGTSTSIQNYAARNAFGLSIDPSVFTVSSAACGNQVSATYSFGFVVASFGGSTLNLFAKSCAPK